MNRLVKGKDFIFNLAGQVSHIESMKNPSYDLEANCETHISVLEACRKHNPEVKIIFTGTRGVYGRTDRLPVTEESRIDPIDINGINKAAAEKYHLLYYKTYGIKTAILRLTNTYGPRHQMKQSGSGFINWFIRLALENKAVNIYNEGIHKRDINYIDDVLCALLLAAGNERSNGEVLNLGSPEALSIKKIAEEILRITGSGRIKCIPYPAELKSLEVGNYKADFSKIERLLGWCPKILSSDGLKRTVEFYKMFKQRYWK